MLLRAILVGIPMFLAALSFAQTASAAIELLISPSGEAATDGFGSTQSIVADLNGDGFADVVVGSPRNDEGGVNAGRVYIFFGGPNMDATPDLVLTGESDNDLFGSAVGGAGDFNGDTYGDVIVGAPFNDAGGVDAGRAYVYFGGPAMDTVADVIFTGVATGDNFGSAVAGAGLVNGDAFADIVVGGPGNDQGGRDTGRAYLFLGGSTPDLTPDAVYTGIELDGFLGRSVAAAGDVNNDTYDDVLIGAPAREDFGFGTRVAHAFVFLGGAVPNGVADVTLTEEAPNDNYAQTVAGVGDVNDDGFDDWMVGAPTHDTGGNNAGRAYLFLGSATPNNVADLTFTGKARGDEFGAAVSGAGDFNDDGFDDMLVGAPLQDGGGVSAGRVYLFHGGTSPDANDDDTLDGESAGDNFGRLGARPGSVSGGSPQFVIGAPSNDDAGSDAGRAYVFSKVGAVPVRLTDFRVSREAEGVVVTWVVADATDHAGFVVHREQGGSRIPLSQRLQGQREYRFVDATAPYGASYWLAEHDRGGGVTWHGPVSARPAAHRPGTLFASPNPFRAETQIRVETTSAGTLSLEVYEVRGRRVRTVVERWFPAGRHTVSWNGDTDTGASAPAGLYFIRLRNGNSVQVRKLLRLPR